MDKPEQYFEGVLQLRNPTQDIIDFVARQIEKTDDVWVAKTKQHKSGIDLYLSSNKFLKHIGKKLNSSFCGELKESRSLFSKNRLTSKAIYRGCVLFTAHDVKVGDTINIKGDKLKIIKIGKDILAKNIENNNKVHISFSQLSK
jgi:NMD protein affecting ribosome stability and mRNA decay